MKRPVTTVLLLVTLVVLMASLMPDIVDSARKGSGRRRGKHRNRGSAMAGGGARLMHMSPRMKAHYEHEDGAEIIKSSHFEYEFEIGHKIVFICVARGFPAPKITWFKEGIELMGHPFLQVREWHLPDQQVKSKLEIDPSRQMDAGTYECEANNEYAVDRKAFKAEFV